MTPHRNLIEQLVELEPIKTWSLIVTLFGDLEGDALTGKQLSALLGHASIKPEAIRVALHRLKKDGWLTSAKNGREVTYRPSTRARHETQSVYEDVYSQDVKYPRGWQVALLIDDLASGNKPDDVIALARNILVAPRNLISEIDGALGVDLADKSVPDWFEERLLPPNTILVATRLVELIEAYEALDEPASDMDATVLRLLFLHRWRKMALRKECWAHIGLFPDGPIAQCHARITGFLE